MPNPTRRPRSIAPGQHVSPRPSLVGRADELNKLFAALTAADSGGGSSVFVVGESGIGKTKLVEALGEHAARRGFATAIGRAYPVETGVPYAVFSDAMMPLLRGIEPPVLTLLTRGGTAELAQLFPALGSADRPASPLRGDPAEVKSRVLWNFTQLLSRLASKKPLLLVLENLQWADSASLEMLHFVARQIGGERILLVGTHNDPDLRGNSALRAAERSLRGLKGAQRLRLQPLGVDDVIALLEQRFGAERARVADFAERLHRWTGGNAFFVDETVTALVQSGQLREAHGSWTGWDVEDLHVPATIREAVLARVADLSTEARRLADVAAVLGAEATHAELAAVSELDNDALIAAIDELRAADVLAERQRGDDIVYDFSHPLLQETLYSEIGLARTRALHGTIAETLERLYGNRAMAHSGRLAFHYARTDTRRLADKAVQYLRAAGRDASAKHANREAADYLTTALELARGAAASGADADDVVFELARVRQRLGDYDGALELWKRALAAASARGDVAKVGSIERNMGLASYWSGAFDQAIAHFDAAIAAARAAGERSLEARVLLPKASCLQALGRTEDAAREIQSAVAIANEENEPGLLARAHRALLLHYLWTGPADQARESGGRAIAIAESAENRNLGVAWSAHWALAMLGGLTGNAEEARLHLADAQRLADEAHSPLFRVWTAEVEIEYAAGIGEWEHAVSLAERTIPLARALGQRTLVPRLLVWLGLLHFGRGDIERGRECVDEAWELSGAADPTAPGRDVYGTVPAHIGRAGYHLARRENAEAIEIGERGLRIADQSGYVVWAIHRLMPIIAEASLWAADHKRARAVAARLRQQSAILGQRLGLAWADACDAVSELLVGDTERALEQLRGATEALEAIPYVADAARLRRQLASALARTGDREGATRELRRAHEVFARLGAEKELSETREQLRELGARPPARSITQGMAGLTGREVEIVRLVAARRSNKEIGAALGISARTASTHLSNIFTKLGVESRGELADRAREAGIGGMGAGDVSS
ncbi:MAG TPA: BREX system ATP-binding domain-containing protein [Gemmatimonadaceae bacterium]|nr:BREX system ATP-binding domain-containing protein [Gemmatimonadaceae bacterium]